MTIWTVELLHQTHASLSRLTRALDADLPQQRPGDSAKSTLKNLQTAASLGVQDVIIVAENGEAVGIATVRNDPEAHTGYARLLYIVPGVESAVADMLVQEVFEQVWNNPAMTYFDGQTFVNQPDIRAAFASRGLQPIARQNMLLTDFSPFNNSPSLPLPEGFHIEAWWPNPGVSLSDSHLDAVADLIVDAYQNTVDESLYPGLNTRVALRRFFAEILFSKQSPFDHDASRIVYVGDGATHMAGQIFCSRFNQTGSVLEIAVRPDYRSKGLGRVLLDNAIRSAAKQGLTAVDLMVTVDNPARRLYESLGFKVTTPFWVYTTSRPKPVEEGSEQNP